MNPLEAIDEQKKKLNSLVQLRAQLMNQLKQVEMQICEVNGVIKFIDKELKTLPKKEGK